LEKEGWGHDDIRAPLILRIAELPVLTTSQMYIFVCSLPLAVILYIFISSSSFFPILLGDENVSLADHMWIS
jgi:hypothetical protein